MIAVRRMLKVHYWGDDSLACDVAERAYSALSSDKYRVTCLRCMYRLGLYVPLVKLCEHQRAQQRDYLDTLALL
jgi:hypothetical protein